jgi:PTS system N-acetylgalactosamine-specific IIA component
MNDARRAVIAGHGEFAAGVISAVTQIAGLGDLFVPVSNTGLAPQGMDALLREALERSGARVIFTDLPAGSCTMAARRIAREDPGICVVTGAALPTVLAWACGCGTAEAVERGRESLKLVEGAGGA